MNTPLCRAMLPMIAAAIAALAGCASTGGDTAYFARSDYGPAPWGHYVYRASDGAGAPSPPSAGDAVAPPLPARPGLPPGAAALPEPASEIPEMGLPYTDFRDREPVPDEPGF